MPRPPSSAGELRGVLERIARRAIADCEGGALVEQALAADAQSASGAPRGPWVVVGAGKAVGAMAAGASRALGLRYLGGPLIGKYAAASAPATVAPWLRLAAHPIPDERGERATRELLATVARARPALLLLLSGGASSLLAAPLAGVPLAELRRVTSALLASGEPIARVNAVRKHLGLALGGRLALAAAVPLTALALSDVVGDDPATIASGPVSPDPSTYADALDVLRSAGIDDGAAVEVLRAGARGQLPETPKPGDDRLARVDYRILGTPLLLRQRAAARAVEAGLQPLVEPELVEGDVADVAARYLARAPRLVAGEVVVAVGEPTVRLVADAGAGGRSQQLVLQVGLGLAAVGGPDVGFLAVGSDGTDGPTDAAGAAVDSNRLGQGSPFDRAAARAALAGNDAYPLLDRLGALIRTGGTGTNLLDLHLLARGPA